MADNNNNMKRESRRDYHGRRPSSGHLWIRIIKWIFLLIFLIVISGIGLFAFYAKDAPNISQDQLQSGKSSSLYTNNGKFLLSLGSEKRIYVKNKDIPQQLKDAVVSVEDKRFYKDKLGVDPIRIIGSMLTNAKSNSIAAGGSTITQQLVKLTVFSTAASQRTLKRKAQEAWLAMKVQHEFSKDQILEFYINKVFMNYGNYGMGTASNYYYGKPLSKLDLAQTALIAGMPNAPVAYDPYLYPQKAKYRRDIVLKTMLQNDKITKAEYNQAVAEPISKGLKSHRNNNESKLRKIDDPYIKEVISEVKSKGFDPYHDNLKITINIDQKAQNKLYELANNGSVPFTNNKMQIGATVVDPNNGHVVAILGGRHLPSVQLGLDRAVQTGRSTGSSIKPVLDYAPAIQYLNWSTAKMIDDSKYDRIICTYSDESNVDYRDSLGILLFHEDNQLRIVSETVNRVYPLDTKDNEAKFSEAQLACQEIPDSYHQTKGFNYECSTGGNSIYIVKKFDLATFDPTSVSESDKEVISTDYTLDQNVQEIATQLEAAGYVCE